MFKCRGCEALKSENTHLKTLISDFQEMLRQSDEKHQEDRKHLVEALLATTKPGGLAALHGNVASRVPADKEPPQINFPGDRPFKRPPGSPAWLGTPTNPAEV